MLSLTSVGQNNPDGSQNIQTMRLRDDPPPITQPQRTSKKRKTPPNTTDSHQQQQQQAAAAVAAVAQQQQQQQSAGAQPIQVLPPPHALMHQMQGPIPPGYPYAPTDYTPGGFPQNPHQGVSIQQQQQQQLPAQSQAQQAASSRTLSGSKRAEQNRKAQRAFRERRDQ